MYNLGNNRVPGTITRTVPSVNEIRYKHIPREVLPRQARKMVFGGLLPIIQMGVGYYGERWKKLC